MALGACGPGSTAGGHPTGSAKPGKSGNSSITGRIGSNEPSETTTTTTTEPPATTLPTIPPAPAVATAPSTHGPSAEAGAGNGQCPNNSNVPVTVEPDTRLDNLFQSYGDSGTGATWTGGDGTESVSLGNGQELWFFADSYLGKVISGQRIRAESHLVHNTLVIEQNGVLTKTPHKRRPKARLAFLNPVPQYPAAYGFWPGSMVVSGKVLQVIGLNVKFTGNGAYSVIGNAVATLALPSLDLLGIRTLPASGTDWSGGALQDGGYTYLYGSAKPNTYAARVAGTDLSAPWSYYDGSGWTSNPAGAVPIEDIGTLSHFSISKVGGIYVFITKSSWTTNEISAAFGCSPIGPFGPPQSIYSTPEGSEYPTGDGVITYGAFAHPELSTLPNTLVVSYDVSAVGPTSGSIVDASLYRPRFLDVAVQ
jgi:Domain of unknown function (DUF5005)